jgi:two-component system, OmpR family, sensor kinase
VFAELRRRCVLLDAGTKYPGIGQPAALGMLAAAVVGLVALPSVREHVLSREASLIVTYVAAAAGAAGAMLIEIVALLARHRRAVWLSAALALYSLVVVPFATVQTASEGAGTVQSVTRLVAYWTVALLLLVALRPPRLTGVWTSWLLAGCGWLLTLAAAEVETPTFGATRSALSSNFAHMALVVAACVY